MQSSRDLRSMTPEEIGQYVETQLAETRSSELESFAELPDPIRWAILLLPNLPRPLFAGVASSAGLSREIEELLRDLVRRRVLEEHRPSYAAAGATETTEATGPDPRWFTVDERLRSNLLDSEIERGGAERVFRAISDMGGQALRLTSPDKEEEAALHRWASLAAVESAGARVDLFERTAAQTDQARDTGLLLCWIEAARPLAALLTRLGDTSLEISVHRAGRRLELLHRERRDTYHLRAFLEREEQIAAVMELISRDDEHWALHLLGSGGVGKTMLLRHLTGRLAPRGLADHKVPTARIDFDYLNADYPRLAPGLLLWSFGQELRSHETTGQTSDWFEKAEYLLRDLSQQIRTGQRRHDGSPTQDPRFLEAVAVYVDALRTLPQPVILVLDTCEELAKVRPDGTVPENVLETFRILEALHGGPQTLLGSPPDPSRGLASLRVVFAGRRPLAREGYGWRCVESTQPPRPYLRLHELRGFNREEAHRYLRELEKIPEELVDPILSRSPEATASSGIDWRDGHGAPAEEERFNPYDLRLLADWAKEVPPPSPETVRRAGADQYIEIRILQRLDFAPLEAAMPALAVLKHVDRETLELLLPPGNDGMLDRVFDQLAQQEWIEVHRRTGEDSADLPPALSVQERLRVRLARYFATPTRTTPRMPPAVADALERRALERDLGTLDWFDLDAAWRALAPEPARAARWWRGVERRILDERGRAWLKEVSGALLSREGAAGSEEPPAGADPGAVRSMQREILASYAASLLGVPGAANDRREACARILATFADQPPTTEADGTVHLRALAGVASALAADTSSSDPDTWRALGTVWRPFADRNGPIDPELSAALVAATEALLERIEADKRRGASLQAAQDSLDALLHGWSAGEVTTETTHAFCARLATLVDATAEASSSGAAALAPFCRVLAARCALAWDPASVLEDAAHEWLVAAVEHLPAATLSTAAPRFTDWVPPADLGARVRLEVVRGLEGIRSVDELLRWTAPSSGRGDSVDQQRLTTTRQRLGLAKSAAAAVESGRADSRALVCEAHRWAPPPAVVEAEAHAAAGRLEEAERLLRSVLVSASRSEPTDLQHAERALLQLTLRHRLGSADARDSSLSRSVRQSDQELAATVVGFGASQSVDIVGGPSGDRVLDRVRDYLASLPPLDLNEPPVEAPAPAIDPSWIDPIGARRFGWIALDEGDRFLAARDPGRAGAAFVVGAIAVARAKDSLGQLHASIRRGLLEAAPGQPTAPALAAVVAQSYETWLASQISWETTGTSGAAGAPPSLPSVEELSGDDPSSVVARLDAAPSRWQPMLRRVALALAMARSEEAAPWRFAGFHPEQGPVETFPADLDHLFRRWLPPTTGAPAPVAGDAWPAPAEVAAPARGSGRRFLKALAAIGQPLLGFGTLGAVLLGLFRVFDRVLLQPVELNELNRSSRIGIFIGVLLVFALGIPWLDRRIRRALAERAVLDFLVKPADGGGEDTPASVTTRPYILKMRLAYPSLGWRRLLPRIAWRRSEVVEEVSIDERRPYTETAAEWPGTFAEAARPVLRRLDRIPLIARCEVIGPVGGPCWEGFVRLAVADGLKEPSDLTLVRRIPLDSTRREPGELQEAAILVEVGERALGDVLLPVWRRVTGPRHALHISYTPGRWEPREPDAAHVLHLIGTVEESYAGLRWRSAGARPSSDFMQQTNAPEQVAGPSVIQRSARDLASEFPRMQLCILQLPLRESSTLRLPTDRAEAALARRYASDLLEAGVPLVLVLPSLEAAVLVPALTALAVAITRRSSAPGETVLARALPDIRRVLAQRLPTTPVFREPLHDVALFSAPPSPGARTR